MITILLRRANDDPIVLGTLEEPLDIYGQRQGVDELIEELWSEWCKEHPGVKNDFHFIEWLINDKNWKDITESQTPSVMFVG